MMIFNQLNDHQHHGDGDVEDNETRGDEETNDGDENDDGRQR